MKSVLCRILRTQQRGRCGHKPDCQHLNCLPEIGGTIHRQKNTCFFRQFAGNFWNKACGSTHTYSVTGNFPFGAPYVQYYNVMESTAKYCDVME